MAADLHALQCSAAAVAELDVLASLAERAEALNWVRPQLVDDDAIIEIVDGRHPVVEQVLDDAFVPNLESIWYTAGYDWLVTVFGPTIVVLDVDVEALNQVGSSRYGTMQAPASAVVDTMEALMDGESGDFKRLHETVDRGFIHVSGTYTGESVRRRRDDSGALIDTDDSGADFEVIALPEPGVGSAR